jgi:hypothetical protein
MAICWRAMSKEKKIANYIYIYIYIYVPLIMCNVTYVLSYKCVSKLEKNDLMIFRFF